MTRIITRLTEMHDTISKVLFIAAGFALAVFTIVFNLEVAKRYLFGTPSTWAQDVVEIAALATTFLALPYVTRIEKHVQIDFVTMKFGDATKHRLRIFQCAVSAIVLFVIAWITLSATLKEYGLGIQTASSIAIPKWPLLALMAWAFFSSALHVLRLIFLRDQLK